MTALRHLTGLAVAVFATALPLLSVAGAPTSASPPAPTTAKFSSCYAIAGAQFTRLAWERETGRIVKDGLTTATVGGLCAVASGAVYSLDVGASAGTVIDSAMFADNQALVALNVGVDYDDLITVGVAPHWITSQPFNDGASYGVGVFISARVTSWLDSVARIFTDGANSAFNGD